jgi:hypothetical protein
VSIDHGGAGDARHPKTIFNVFLPRCQTILSVLARSGIKFSTARRWGWDDSAAAISSLFAIAYTGTMAASYKFGMGQKMSAGGSGNIDVLEKVRVA